MAFLQALRDRAGANPRTLVFAEGHDPRIQEACIELARSGLARPVVLGSGDPPAGLGGGQDEGRPTWLDPTRGDADRYAEVYRRTRAARSRGEAHVERAVHDPLVRAALMVSMGEADGMVAGVTHATADVVRAGIRCIGPAAGIRTVSSSFYMVVPPFRSDEEEVLTFTDAGVVPDPDAEQLAEIAVAAARARRLVVGDDPRVAFLSYSTRGSAAGASVERVVEALDIFRSRMPDVPADGELQADAALVASVAGRKAPRSEVAGRANILVFPDLDAGNIAYKLVQRLARATALGPILQGLSRPCNDLSRGASSQDVVDVACITSLMAG